MVLGLKWQQRREAFSALRNRMKNSYLFYKGVVVIVVIVEEFLYISFFMSHENGVFVCLKSKRFAGVYHTPNCKKKVKSGGYQL